MNTYVDCPKCGTEFMVSDQIASATLRCPDCLQWFSEMDYYGSDNLVSAYSSHVESFYDEMGFEAGYDY